MANLKIDGNLDAGGLYIEGVNIYEKIYPINFAIIVMGDGDYSNYLGLKWERVSAGYALWTATSGAGNTIPAGLPNITGTFRATDNNETKYSSRISDAIGCFQAVNDTARPKMNCNGSQSNDSNPGQVKFDANNGAKYWNSASAGIYGNSTTVQPPAIKICAWKRTA